LGAAFARGAQDHLLLATGAEFFLGLEEGSKGWIGQGSGPDERFQHVGGLPRRVHSLAEDREAGSKPTKRAKRTFRGQLPISLDNLTRIPVRAAL
jgi:hypothetical protein